LEMFIHVQFAADVSFNTGSVDIDLVAIRLAPDGVKQVLPADDLAAFEFCKDAITFLIEPHLHDLLAKPEYCAELTQLKAQTLDDFAVDEFQQVRTQIEKSYFYA